MATEYGIDLYQKLTTTWEVARKCVRQAQQRQKVQYDRRSTVNPYKAGERVFLFKPTEKTGEARKLTCPFHGPYRIVELDTNTPTLKRVDRPEEDVRVAIDRLRRCPEEIGSDFWPPRGGKRWQRKSRGTDQPDNRVSDSEEYAGGPSDDTQMSQEDGMEKERRHLGEQVLYLSPTCRMSPAVRVDRTGK